MSLGAMDRRYSSATAIRMIRIMIIVFIFRIIMSPGDGVKGPFYRVKGEKMGLMVPGDGVKGPFYRVKGKNGVKR